MIKFRDKRFFVKRLVIENPTLEEYKAALQEKSDLILLYNMTRFDEYANDESFHVVKTWMLDYSEIVDEDDLFSKQSKTIRNCVKQSQNIGVEYRYEKGNEISNNTINRFEKMCNEMYKIRGLKTKINVKFLKKYRDNNNLLISYSLLNNAFQCFSVYVIDGITARTWFSCSLIHKKDSDDQLLSKIKRFSKYNDLLLFYRLNYEHLDYGGINSFDNPDGRALYKMHFAGHPQILLEKCIVKSRKGAFFSKIKQLIYKLLR